jgi:isopropylmalate/homocitrate/citramalate synthase
VNGTLLSTGERTGNSPVEAAVVEYASITGETGLDLKALTEIGEYMRRECGVEVPASYPLIGSEFNVTRAGIHADGLLKDEEIYNVFDTAGLLGRPIGVGVNDKSGVAGVALWASLRSGTHVDKHDPGVVAMYSEIQRLYATGRTTGMTQDELVALGERYLATMFSRRPLT